MRTTAFLKVHSLGILFCLCLLCSSILVACSPTHKVEIEKLTNITVFYTNDQNETQSIDFDADSTQLASIKTWLEKNKKGWEQFLVTPPMGDILITSQNISLNIGEDWVILRQTKGSDSVSQLRKTLSTSDFDYFKTLR